MYFPQIFSLNLYEVFPVFRRLFGSEERKRLTLELYNAINQTDYDNPGTGVAKGRTLGEDRLTSLISASISPQTMRCLQQRL